MNTEERIELKMAVALKSARDHITAIQREIEIAESLHILGGRSRTEALRSIIDQMLSPQDTHSVITQMAEISALEHIK